MSDPVELQRILGGSTAPAGLTRAARVALLGEVADALLTGRMPTREAALFLAGGLRAWLEHGGNLTRGYWRVSARAGSHHTESHVWRELSSSRGARADDDYGILSSLEATNEDEDR